MIKRFNKSLVKSTEKAGNHRGFSLVEIIITITIMVVLIGISAPILTRHIHRAKVAADWENLKAYYDEIQVEFIATGEYDSRIPTTHIDKPENWQLKEIQFLDGRTVKMKDGYFAISKSVSGNGYQISYYCNKCLSDWDKHSKTCIIVLGV